MEVYTNKGRGLRSENNTLAVTSFKSVSVDQYVCTGCGYIERYVSDRGDLEGVAAKWQKASE